MKETRMSGYIVTKIDKGEKFSESKCFATIEEARKYIEEEYLLDTPDEENSMEYNHSDNVKIVIEKAPSYDELMEALTDLLDCIDDCEWDPWNYMHSYHKLADVIRMVGSTDNWK